MNLPRLSFLVCLLVPSCAWPDAPQTGPSAPPPTSRPIRGKPDGLPVPMNILFESYEKSAAEADQEYRDKVLILESTIHAVDPFGDPPYVELYVPIVGGGAYVRCRFDSKDKDELAKLKPGSGVTIKGRCAGAINNFVTLEGCTVVRYREQK